MDTIKLLGINWDKENAQILNDNYSSFENAQRLAANEGKRLPSKEEFEALCHLPHVWDSKRNGIWFAEKVEELKDENKSLFLPACGYRQKNSIESLKGTVCYYWSNDMNGDMAHYLYCVALEQSVQRMPANIEISVRLVK